MKITFDILLGVVSCLNANQQLPILLSISVDALHSKKIYKNVTQNDYKT